METNRGAPPAGEPLHPLGGISGFTPPCAPDSRPTGFQCCPWSSPPRARRRCCCAEALEPARLRGRRAAAAALQSARRHGRHRGRPEVEGRRALQRSARPYRRLAVPRGAGLRHRYALAGLARRTRGGGDGLHPRARRHLRPGPGFSRSARQAAPHGGHDGRLPARHRRVRSGPAASGIAGRRGLDHRVRRDRDLRHAHPRDRRGS